MTPFQQRAEEYRVKLGLMPWSDFAGQRMKEIDKDERYTPEQKQLANLQRRQCGNTTKGLLEAIAEAEHRGRSKGVL